VEVGDEAFAIEPALQPARRPGSQRAITEDELQARQNPNCT
jgi:hypothetical protein